ncbi:MAG TPA: MBL fold metallo-hydrolase [Actinomyces sp.]|jgi:hydroxyacylglutathione hydrolase|nr:MBL fold metallo-hydrolase [Acidobacteriota bacterium]HHT41387.1 MBL fold metallo-hydrolase [Actinomyces sp.]
MRIERIESTIMAENAYVVTPRDSRESLIVDPGFGTVGPIEKYLQENELEAKAVLLTHGHPDHVWDAAAFDLPVYIPKPDMYRLDDPMAYLPAAFGSLGDWTKPTDVRPIPSQLIELVPGLPILMIPAPGHTEGSAIFLTSISGGDTLETNAELPGTRTGLKELQTTQPLAFVGDVIFAGSVGRTDLPGGDETQMRQSLRTLANAVDPKTWMLPGHGPATHWAHEQETNPYVRRAKEVG